MYFGSKNGEDYGFFCGIVTRVQTGTGDSGIPVYEDKMTAPFDGAIQISDERYQELLEGQSLGKIIVPDESGMPILANYPTPSLPEQKSIKENELWSNYKAHQTKYVDAEDLTLATICAAYGSEKGKAVQMWVMGLWSRYYEVKDAVAAAETAEALAAIDLTAEAVGVPPYTIRELNEEAASYLAGAE